MNPSPSQEKNNKNGLFASQGVSGYSCIQKMVHRATLLLPPWLGLWNRLHNYSPLLIELGSLGAQLILGCSGELPMGRNSASDPWHPFPQILIEWQFFFPPNHPSVLSYATFEFQKGRRQAFFLAHISPKKTIYALGNIIYCRLVKKSEQFTSLKQHVKYKTIKFSLLFLCPLKLLSRKAAGKWLDAMLL